MTSPVDTWHTILEKKDPSLLNDLLSESVVFHSPVVHTPQVGKPITTLYLASALNVFVNDTFHYVREVIGKTDAILEFEVEINGIHVNGVDMMKWDETGKLVEFKVMLRPLKAVNLIHEHMGEMLKKLGPKK